MDKQKIKIQADGENCQAAYSIVNKNFSFNKMKMVCESMMFGAVVLLMFVAAFLLTVPYDYWVISLIVNILSFGTCWFVLSFVLAIIFSYVVVD